VSLSRIFCAEDLAMHIKGIVQDVLSGEPGKAGMGSVQNRGRSVQRHEIGPQGIAYSRDGHSCRPYSGHDDQLQPPSCLAGFGRTRDKAS